MFENLMLESVGQLKGTLGTAIVKAVCVQFECRRNLKNCSLLQYHLKKAAKKIKECIQFEDQYAIFVHWDRA